MRMYSPDPEGRKANKAENHAETRVVFYHLRKSAFPACRIPAFLSKGCPAHKIFINFRTLCLFSGAVWCILPSAKCVKSYEN